MSRFPPVVVLLSPGNTAILRNETSIGSKQAWDEEERKRWRGRGCGIFYDAGVIDMSEGFFVVPVITLIPPKGLSSAHINASH